MVYLKRIDACDRMFTDDSFPLFPFLFLSFADAFDSLNTIYYDEERNDYVAHARYVRDWSSRTVMTSRTNDLLSWPNEAWKEIKFEPSLERGTSIYLMNAHKCPLQGCPYILGFNTRYNSNPVQPECMKHRLGRQSAANCENGHQDIVFSISEDNDHFVRPKYFNIFEKEFGDNFPRNIWTVAGALANHKRGEVNYFILHDSNFPQPFIRRYTLPFYRYSSVTCGADPCIVRMKRALASDIIDIKLNARTNNMYGKITYKLNMFRDGRLLDMDDQICNYANAAEFYGDELAYSLRFGRQRWLALLEKTTIAMP